MPFFIAPITIKLERKDIERALFEYACKNLGAQEGEVELTKAEIHRGTSATLTVIRTQVERSKLQHKPIDIDKQAGE